MDIVLAKLVAFQKTGSDKHLRDALGVLLLQWGPLNLEAIRRGATEIGTDNILNRFQGETRGAAR